MKLIERLKTRGRHTLIGSHPYWRKVLPSFYYPYRFRGGRIYLDITESQMMAQRVLGVYEPTKYKALSFFLRRGGIFIDVGSNKGDFALFSARLVGNAGQVVAIEPESTNCHWIKRSITRNGYSNVTLREVALSDYVGKVPLYRSNLSGHHSLLAGLPGGDKGVIEVETMLLDDLIEELGLSGRVTVIKIDVEGAEMRVLRGAKKTLQARPQPVLLMDLHPRLGVATEEVCDFLEDLGYTLYREFPPFDVPVINRHDIGTLVARPTVSPG